MRFEEALKAMREGKKVKLAHSSWLNCCYFCTYKGETSIVADYYESDKLYKGMLIDFTSHQILSEDWEVLNEG